MALKITIASSHIEPEIFDGVVWTLPISNKDLKMFSKDASNCRIGIDIMENKTSKYGQEIPLYWLRDNQLPTRCSVGTSLPGKKTIRQEYADELPFAYMCALRCSPQTSIPKDGKDESIFLFTFPEGQSLHIVPAFSIGRDRIDALSLAFNREYDVRVRFHSNEYNYTDGKRFTLIAKSWEDVRLK
jgi:hypothetical protein